MNIQILLLLASLGVAVVLFSVEKISAELTALGLLLFLVLTGLLPAAEAFAGFGSEVFVMLLGLLILMAALERTGVTDAVGRALLQHTGSHPLQLLIVVMVAALLIGGFVSNTAATAFFLPIVITLARQRELSPARFLMPLAFASILASSITLIGTSTNIMVSGLMVGHGLEPIEMFELTPVGVPIALVGLAYMVLLGRHLVPDRVPRDQIASIDTRLYFSEILLPKGSTFAGQTLQEAALGRDLDLTVVRIVRNGSQYIIPDGETRLEEKDVLLVEGHREAILRTGDIADLEIRPDVKFPLMESEESVSLSEVIVLPSSPFVGRSLRSLDFRNRYGIQVLAINRRGATLKWKMSRVRLRTGDVLVVQGERRQLDILERQDLFRILSTNGKPRPRQRRAPLAGAIFVSVLALATFEIISLPVAMLLGAFLVMVTRCITPEEAYARVNWTALILVASMLGLGRAMETTGAAAFIADGIVGVVGEASPIWLLSGFFLLTVLLTQPMSNQASAAVVLPVAFGVAERLALNPRAFGIMITLAASTSFLTPLEPACLLVYGAGHYRFLDFPRVGALLSFLVYLIAILMVPWLWPLS